MAKAPHPTEAFEAAIIENAVSWTAFQLRSPFDRQKFEGLTRDQAREAAHAMLEDCPRKSVLIYAIDAQGCQALAETVRL
jgi:hypothetical protein